VLALAGDTAIDVTVLVGAVTLSVAVPLIPLKAAVTVVEPDAAPVATPLELIVAIVGAPTVHAAVEVTLAVEPSL
jgi:hypothetical protein